MASGSHSKRKKKRSQERSKKRIKSTKDKIKKRKRRHDSVSSSDDDSVSSSSVSCYSSEDDYRSRKRFRSRDGKVRKKRAKRSRLVSESSGDDTRRLKKRKRSKKSKGSESRKKRHGKKRRRDPSVSVSSEQGNSCDDNEREFEKSETKDRKGRNKGKERSGRKKSRHRSRSCSPSSLRSVSHSYDSEERVMEEVNPKRLKSVIVATHDIKEIAVRESNLDGNKDEIVFEHDDYPSRSNDSNDGMSKTEGLLNLPDVSSEKPRSIDDSNRLAIPADPQTSDFQNDLNRLATTTSAQTSGLPESQRLAVGEGEGVTLVNVNSGGNQLKETRIDVSVASAGSNRDDLEILLRQKALENLLKRQGKLPIKNAVDKKGILDKDVKVSSPLESDQVERVSGAQRGVRSVQDVGTMGDANITNAPSSPKAQDVQPQNCRLGTRIPTGNMARGDYVNSGSKLVSAKPSNIFVGGSNTWKRQLAPQESSQTNPSAVKETLDDDYRPKLILQESSKPKLSGKIADDDYNKKQGLGETLQANLSAAEEAKDEDSKQRLILQTSCQLNVSAAEEAVVIDSSRGSESAKVSANILNDAATSKPSAAGGQSSNASASKTDEDSQFQQKTMSVMRGGEMVQVSYKVYIPNKASSRRRLKR